MPDIRWMSGTDGQGPSGSAGGAAALRFGAKPARPFWGWAGFTRRSVRGLFRHVHAAAKNDSDVQEMVSPFPPGRALGHIRDAARHFAPREEIFPMYAPPEK